ncbi:MAG: extracellular solute-binding protein [Eubacteriales bacterium]|nr:extracellular solute-binding protein [Eubacteriales bacterium]
MKNKRYLTIALTAALMAGTLPGSAALAAEEGGFTEVSLPLTEEKETLTVWVKNDVTLMNACGGDLNNTPFFQELEERTNVHIEWIVPASGTEQEQFNLLMSSGKLPDIMYTYPNQVYYPDGLDAAVEDGYFLDLTDLLPQYAPNYLAAIEKSDEDTKQGVKTDAGRSVLMYSVMQEEQPTFYGYVVRQDWLDELGLSVPVTYDDWEEMLTQFKETYNAAAPLSINSRFFWNLGIGMGAYAPNDFYQEDGVVHNALLDDTEAVREFLTLMNRWYQNGLIDPDFASSTAFWGDSVLVTNNNTGAFLTMYTFPSAIFLPSMEEGASFTAVKTPVKEEGDTLEYGTPVPSTTSAYAVTTDCENPELAVSWIDYLFSEEGAMLANYGVEGETYTLDADGTPVFTETITANPDGLTYDEAMRTYLMAPSFPVSYYDWKRELQFISEDDFNMCYIWDDVNHEKYYSSYAAMTVEENAEYSNLFADIDTYISENALSFITGAKSLDEFDSFIETVKGMGLPRCVELKQAALDRYNAR